MIEDALRNLDAPKLMGWKTVFIGDQRDELVQEAKEHGHDCIVDGIMDAMPYFFELAKSARDVDGSAAAAAAAAHQGEKDE